MQDTGARRLREDEYREPRPPRHLRVVEEAHSAAAADSYRPTYAENGRRTVTITGHPVPARRRRSVTQSHIEARPDRIALWAFLLGLFLVFMAVATANAAPL
jgi:thiol:disulfide interchange protein